jgi:hypothetical protein
MLRSPVVLTLVMLLIGIVCAQEKKSVEVTGFLIDTMCATGKEAKDKEHPVSCALMPKCEKSGYAVVAGDSLYKLDENGNKLAVEILKNTKAKNRLAVQLKGTVENDVVHVDSLTEVAKS